MKVIDILLEAPLDNAHSRALRDEATRLAADAAAKQAAHDAAEQAYKTASPASQSAAKAAYKSAKQELKAANASLKQANADVADDESMRRKEIKAHNARRAERLSNKPSASGSSKLVATKGMSSADIGFKQNKILKLLKIFGRITLLHELVKPLTDYSEKSDELAAKWNQDHDDAAYRSAIHIEEKRLAQRLIAEIAVVLATTFAGGLARFSGGLAMKAIKYILTLGLAGPYGGLPKVAAFSKLLDTFGTEQLLQYMNSKEGQQAVSSIMGASILNTFSNIGAEIVDQVDFHLGPAIREKDPTGLIGPISDIAGSGVQAIDKLGRGIEDATPAPIANITGATDAAGKVNSGLARIDPKTIPRAEKPLSAYADAQAPATTQPAQQSTQTDTAQQGTTAPAFASKINRNTAGVLATPSQSYDVGVGQKVAPRSQEGWQYYKPGYVINPETNEVQPKL